MIERSESVTEWVDITQYPKDIEQNPSDQVTIGDLHGNALKFIYFLVKEGVLQLDKSRYDRIKDIYLECTSYDRDDESPLPKKTDFWAFRDIINHAKINPKVSNNPNFVVRLMGDEVADRGANDYFILKIFEKLSKGNVRIETLFSNHGVEFIEAMESKDIAAFESTLDFFGQVNSLKTLQQLITKKLTSEKEVKELYENHYQPCFKAISYTISDDDSITIYTHAPVGLETIKAVAEKLGIEYADASAKDLAKTIDLINSKFQEHYVQKGQVKTLYNSNNKDNCNCTPNNDPFACLMWRRNPNSRGQWYDIKRPEQHNGGYKLFFVHGHDGEASVEDNVYNLNNELGKFTNTEGEYAVVKVSGSSQLTETENLGEKAHSDLSAASFNTEDLLKLVHDEQPETTERESPIEPPQVAIQAKPKPPKITVQTTAQPAARSPDVPPQKVWFNVYSKDKATYCILESSSDSSDLSEKINALKAKLNNDETALPGKSQENITNANFSQNQTRISHYPLYAGDDLSSTIQAYGLVEGKNADNSLSSQLHLSEEVNLFSKDSDGNETEINDVEFKRLLVVIDQQIKSGISACGSDPTKDKEDITLTLTIQNANNLNIYEKAYLFYCKQAGYNYDCIDSSNTKIKVPDIMSDDALQESGCIGITLAAIQQQSTLQDTFLKKSPENPDAELHEQPPHGPGLGHN